MNVEQQILDMENTPEQTPDVIQFPAAEVGQGEATPAPEAAKTETPAEQSAAETTPNAQPAESVTAPAASDEKADEASGDDATEHAAQSEILLAKIAEAEQECEDCFRTLNGIKEDLKSAKKDYDAAVTRLRRLCSSDKNAALRPIIVAAEKANAVAEVTHQGEADATALADSQANAEAKPSDRWRAVPTTELLSTPIKGFGDKKREALLDACPTVGALEDLRAGEGLTSIDGIGETLASEIENAIINWLAANRDKMFDEQPAPAVENKPEATAGKLSILPTVDTSTPLTADQWNEMTDEQQSEWIICRASVVGTGELDEQLATKQPEAWDSATEAHSRGIQLHECPYIPGDKQDSWIRSWLIAAADDEEADALADDTDEEDAEDEEQEEASEENTADLLGNL